MSTPLPKEWTIGRLGDVARVYSGGTPSRRVQAYWGGNIPWVTTAELDNGHITATRESITEAGLANSAARMAGAGTLLLAMYGQGKTRGKVAMLKVPAAMNQACAAVEVGGRLDALYLFQFLQARYNAIRAISNSGSQENLTGDIVRGIAVVVPPIREQRAIAEVLATEDVQVAVLARLIAKKQAIRQGLMERLLTGKTRLHGFTDNWTLTTLGALGTILKGRGVKRDDVRSSGVRCIRYGELYTAFHDYTAEARSFVSPQTAATALPLRAGDLLFAGSGETRQEIGKCVAYVGPTPAVAGGDVIVLRSDQINPIFLALLVNTPEIMRQKARAGQGDAVVHIYGSAVSAIEVSLPTRAEQDAIAKVIVDVDRELDLLRQRLAKARDLKQGMLQELLTGRTRLSMEATP